MVKWNGSKNFEIILGKGQVNCTHCTITGIFNVFMAFKQDDPENSHQFLNLPLLFEEELYGWLRKVSKFADKRPQATH